MPSAQSSPCSRKSFLRLGVSVAAEVNPYIVVIMWSSLVLSA
jgi:hypothetical protein